MVSPINYYTKLDIRLSLSKVKTYILIIQNIRLPVGIVGILNSGLGSDGKCLFYFHLLAHILDWHE